MWKGNCWYRIMKINGMKKLCMSVSIALSMFYFTGCNETVNVWKPIADNTIKIAVVGDDEYIEEDDFMKAAEMAADDFFDKTGIKIEIVIYDDDAEYNLAISRAKEIASDNSISAVLIKQELDFIDSTAEIFNNAEKPFVLIDGCYKETIEKKYEYMVVDCINAEIAGKLMAEYVEKMNYKNIAFCHSNTKYEEDELKGFQNNLSNNVKLVDTLVGPYCQEDFDIAYQKWVCLDVDAVCVSNYDILNSDVVRMIREKGSNINVISDYVMDSGEDINSNGMYMDGTAIVGRYIKGQQNSEISSAFKMKYGIDMNESSIQAYDIITLIANELESGISESNELVNNIKSGKEYESVYGTFRFDNSGCLVPNGNEILVFKNGMFE